MAKMLDEGFEVSEFELQLRYYVHFRTNTNKKAYEPHYPLSNVFNSITTTIL